MAARRRNITETTDKDPPCSGLIFIAAAIDDYLRAFDLDTGKQYVVIAAGGHGRAGTTLGDSLVAFALPD
ncbi:MAG: hypothetical protein IID08_01910 [Candidatus Hydrogenedentes bacterium]|nr:hypothetical protein [Candidatus Hydrogenedentota bacterium]